MSNNVLFSLFDLETKENYGERPFTLAPSFVILLIFEFEDFLYQDG